MELGREGNRLSVEEIKIAIKIAMLERRGTKASMLLPEGTGHPHQARAASAS